jgi:hypothetical protein
MWAFTNFLGEFSTLNAPEGLQLSKVPHKPKSNKHYANSEGKSNLARWNHIFWSPHFIFPHSDSIFNFLFLFGIYDCICDVFLSIDPTPWKN